VASVNYSVDDEFGNIIAGGFETYDAAAQCARRYLSENRDAPSATIYEDSEGGESWDVSLDDL